MEQKDVTPDHIDIGGGRTPLSLAAQNGGEEIAKWLLEREDVNPDYVDGYNPTPLSWATLGGHERVIRMFLELKDISDATLDRTRQTPP